MEEDLTKKEFRVAIDYEKWIINCNVAFMSVDREPDSPPGYYWVVNGHSSV